MFNKIKHFLLILFFVFLSSGCVINMYFRWFKEYVFMCKRFFRVVFFIVFSFGIFGCQTFKDIADEILRLTKEVI